MKIKSYATKPDDECDAEAERERTRAGGRGTDQAGRAEDLTCGIEIVCNQAASVGASVLRWVRFFV